MENENSETQVLETIESLKTKQNYPLGLVGGIATAVASAILWAVVTVITGYQIGWMAVGVGALVGFSIRKLGNGFESKFGYTGAALALAGCIIGNYLSIIGFISQETGISFMLALKETSFSIFIQTMKEGFSVIDIVFYGLAIYEGFRFSMKKMK